jgi:hypothetical protein
MYSLWIDAEVEGFLVTETRNLVLPDGCIEPVTLFRLIWDAYDHVLTRGYTPEEISEWAMDGVKLQNLPINDAFESIIRYVDDLVRRR